MVDVNKPVRNDELKKAIETMRAEQNQTTTNRMIDHVMLAHFLQPAVMDKEPKRQVDGSAIIEEDTRIQFPMLVAPDERKFAMAFCDWDELAKWKHEEGQQTVVFTFDDYAAMVLQEDSTIDGFVIDPYGANLVFDKALITSLKQQKDAMEKRVKEMEIKAGAKVQLGQPKEYPQAMVDALSEKAKEFKKIQAIYMQLMIQEETQSYLLVVDYDGGDERAMYDALAQTAATYSDGKYVDFAPIDSDLGKAAIRAIEPFYKKPYYTKPKFKEAFMAVIEEIYALKNGDVVLICKITSGHISVGDEVAYEDEQRNVLFHCTILEMEQPSGKVESAGWDANGKYGPHFAMRIPYHKPEEFKQGNFLTK